MVYDDNNQPKTVAYQALSSLLLNEFQKAHGRGLASEARAQLELAVLTAREEAQRGRQELVSLRAQMRQVQRTVQRLVAAAQGHDASVAAVAP